MQSKALAARVPEDLRGTRQGLFHLWKRPRPELASARHPVVPRAEVVPVAEKHTQLPEPVAEPFQPRWQTVLQADDFIFRE